MGSGCGLHTAGRFRGPCSGGEHGALYWPARDSTDPLLSLLEPRRFASVFLGGIPAVFVFIRG